MLGNSADGLARGQAPALHASEQPSSLPEPSATPNFHLPIIRPPNIMPSDNRQTTSHVQAIISLPIDVLARLARTNNYQQQAQIVAAPEFLKSLALDTPPSAETNTQQPLPLDFERMYGPLTAGIVAPSTETVSANKNEHGLFGAIITSSLDQWARDNAAMQVNNPAEMESIAAQLKAWKEEHQRELVRSEIDGIRQKGFQMGAQYAQIQNVNVSAWRGMYIQQLTQLAGNFYNQLHSESLRKVYEDTAKNTTNASNNLIETDGLKVQASAVAAISANYIAAKLLEEKTLQSLSTVGLASADATASMMPPKLSQPLQPLQIQPQVQQLQHTLPQQVSSSSHPIVPQQQFSPLSNNHHTPQNHLQLSQPPTPINQNTFPPAIAEAYHEIMQNPQCDEASRNLLLSYALNKYSQAPDSSELIPLLNTLDKAFPAHAPTLVLLSCVHLAIGTRSNPVNRRHLEYSYLYNEKVLNIDPGHVEAMSNIGTTLRSLGKYREAEIWWEKAVLARPHYFDAFEFLIAAYSVPQDGTNQARTNQAYQLCKSVESALFKDIPNPRPICLPPSVPFSNVHKLLGVFSTKGNFSSTMGNIIDAKNDYEKGVELVLSAPTVPPQLVGTPHATPRYALRHLLYAAAIAGLYLQRAMSGDVMPEHPAVAQIASMCGGRILDAGHPVVDLLYFCYANEGPLAEILLQPGRTLPMVLLQPESLQHFFLLIFSGSSGQLPVLGYAPDKVSETIKTHVNSATGTLFVTMSKIFQDSLASPQLAANLCIEGITTSTSLVLLLYYVSVAINPAASTYNNLGILLSTLTSTAKVVINNQLKDCGGQLFAMMYYTAGLTIDSTHPHLYTNLGSLYKDMGNLQYAIKMYKEAVHFNPHFDIALANLANAIKDMGQVQDSIQWYQRAVQLNPNFPEAICGLVNALGGICDWRGRGIVDGDVGVDEKGNYVEIGGKIDNIPFGGWMQRIRQLVREQLDSGVTYGKGIIKNTWTLDEWLQRLNPIGVVYSSPEKLDIWKRRIEQFYDSKNNNNGVLSKRNEGGFIIRMIELITKMTQRQWYLNVYGNTVSMGSYSAGSVSQIQVDQHSALRYRRPALPTSLPAPTIPTVLPFHTFTYPLPARDIRLISHRNALRLSHITLSQPWLPQYVYPPPAPPCPRLNIGYVSSDFNNHPLAHLMQSVFGFHDASQFNVVCYATTSAAPDDKYRQKIEKEAHVFHDVSTWPTQNIIQQILSDQIHILVNLNGYTKGAKNEIFAARPCPVTAQFMGFCGSLGAGWNDWLVSDVIATPPELVSCERWRQRRNRGSQQYRDGPTDFEGSLDPEDPEEPNWVYTEKIVYMPQTYFINDHKQGFREPSLDTTVPESTNSAQLLANHTTAQWMKEEERRAALRQEIFPNLQNNVIFANFNQLYKIDPTVFKIWLDILRDVPNSVLWLLRFPAAGEEHILSTAEKWAGPEIRNRIIFTDVCDKSIHILRGRVADIFLDCTECNSHTTASDILWSGTPILTWPRHKHKMCSRVAASVANATGYGEEMTVNSGEEYHKRAVELAKSIQYVMEDRVSTSSGLQIKMWCAKGEAVDLRKRLFLSREQSALFDTKRWVHNLEKSYWEMWKRWVNGTVFENSAEWESDNSQEAHKLSGCIWIGNDGNIMSRPPVIYV